MHEELNIAEFRAIGNRLRGICGLHFADDKFPRIAKIIGTRMSELSIQRYSDYEHMLAASPDDTGELTVLAALLTIGETHFLRNRQHWLAFEECVLPWIIERSEATGQRRIRIWSAGCSTGEEAYTIALSLHRSLADLASWSIEITGTDLNPAAIAGARESVYTEHSFRGVPPEIKEEYFETLENGLYSPRADLRAMVRFKEMNLLDSAATARMRDVDVIFCRNVLIYFDAQSVARVLEEFQRSLRPDGYLFLGHAESSDRTSSGFASKHVCNTFIHRSISSAAHGASQTDGSPCHPRGCANTGAAGSSAELRQLSSEQQPRADERRDAGPVDGGLQAGASGRGSSETDQGPELGAPTQPSSVAAAALPSLDDLRVRAIEHLCAEERVEARQTFEEIHRREPDDPGSLLGLGVLLAGSGSNEEALQCCERVLQLQPMSAEAYCVMALVHEGLGEDGVAQRELEKAVYLDHGFSIAHFRLADLHSRAQRQEAARLAFNNTLKALPDDDEGRVRLYSGGFSKDVFAQVCERRIGTESLPTQDPEPGASA